MLKKKLKTFACILALVVLISSISFATTENNIEPRTEENSTVENVNVTSENPEENTTTTSDEQNTTDESTETSDETYYEELVSDDLYKFEDTIEVSNLIDGNAYLFGDEVTISGQIGGDAFVVAKNLNITKEGYIYGNLFVIAENITIDGIVCDLYSISQKLDVNDDGIILRDMRSISGNINLTNADIGRNTYLKVGNLTVGEGTVIYGNLNYESATAITVPEGVVNGSINYSAGKEGEAFNYTSKTVTDYVISWVTTILFTLLVFGLLLLFAPHFVKKAENAIHKNAFITLGIGILAWLIIAITLLASLFLLLTIIGAPLAFIIALLCSIPLSLASTLAIIAIASLLGGKVSFLGKAHNLLAIILVATIVWALTSIPFYYIGTIISAIVTVFGLGLFAFSIFTKKETSENIIKE